MKKQNRIPGIDFLKCVAIFTIPSQHFFSHHSHFRDSKFDTISMFIQSVGMEFFLIGVPLFIAITGYLNNQIQPTWNYYKKSLKVIIPYILISIVYIFFRRIYFNEEINAIQGLNMILHFNAISYAWYVEMWIGLFFLAPFLNILYNNIKDERTSFFLIVTLYVMTYLTMTLNREGIQILPDYWISLSPLTCYFIGCHLKKFDCSLSNKCLIVLLFTAILAEPLINVIFFPNNRYYFILGIYLTIVPAMWAFFGMYHKWIPKKKWILKPMQIISDHTLEMYLYCALCDMVLYPYFMQWYINQSQFGLFFFAIISIEIIASFCIAWVTRQTISLFRINRLWK